MLKSSAIIVLLAVGLGCAASVEKRTGTARDGAHHAPAPAPAAAPAQSYDGGSQGNLYYYYYPVESYGSSAVEDSGFDIFTAILLPLLILGGVLLVLSSLSFTVGRRSLGSETDEVMDKLHREIENAFYIYWNAFESEHCVERLVCESGVYAKDIKGNKFILR